MNVRNLSDYQLYSLVQNGKLAPFIRVAAGQYLGLHQKKKWNDFLLYTAIGYLFWTFAIILFFRQPD